MNWQSFFILEMGNMELDQSGQNLKLGIVTPKEKAGLTTTTTIYCIYIITKIKNGVMTHGYNGKGGKGYHMGSFL